jgi:predicted TIM-barrel fold metal-dependent hydrolase
MTVDVTEADRRIYELELKGFLPSRIFDAHVHMLDRTCLRPGYQYPPRSIMAKVGGVFTMEQCQAWARAILPDKEYHSNSFGNPSFDSDLDASAAYSGRIADNRRSFAMALVAPRDSREAVIRRVEKNRLIGYKPYLDFVEGKGKADITIHDMLPAPQMEAADERGLAITLHIPRPGRLADPVNQAQMVEICRRYPRAKIIFAHIGRAYYLQNIIGMLEGIAACPNAYVDTAMVNHEGVLEHTFRHFPRDRILFGSDAPVACLHGKSVEINNQYAYLMAEDYEIGTSIVDDRHAVTFTTFFHEQLRGIKLAAERAGLSRSEIEDFFFNNAHRLFSGVAERNYGKGSA